MVVASTTEVLITAAFGLAGTLIGALIAGTVAVTQRRGDKDERVQNAAIDFIATLEDLVEEPSLATLTATDYAYRVLSIRAEVAGIDKDLASGSLAVAQSWYRQIYREKPPDLDLPERRRFADLAVREASVLMTAARIPYRKRRGRFMDLDLKKKRDDVAIEAALGF